MTTFEDRLSTLPSLSSEELRRFVVTEVTLQHYRQHHIEAMEPPESLLKVAHGAYPTPEHAGVISRLVYQMRGGRHALLQDLPSPARGSDWSHRQKMTQLIMLLFEPWNDIRYDPRSETAVVCQPSGQWSFRLKGKDTEGAFQLVIQRYLSQLSDYGFNQVLQWLIDYGLVSADPTEYGLEADAFAYQLAQAPKNFHKWLHLTPGVVTQVMKQLVAEPLMMFDTAVINSVKGFAALGNGVVPTTDVRDADGEIMYPAGILIPADREFMIGSAAGINWRTDTRWNELMEHRVTVDHAWGTEDTWEDWRDGAVQFADLLLSSKAPTYKSFLDHAFPHTPDEVPEERDAFLRTLGAACFGSDMKLVTALIGAPNAGKDTVIKWLGYLLGEHQVGALSQNALTAHTEDERAFATLKGAKVAVVSGEVGDGRQSGLLAEKIKSLTSGGGLLRVAEKYEKPSSIFFDGMLIIQGNSVPSIIGGDNALYVNRLVPVPFEHPFPLQANSYERQYRNEAPAFMQVLFLHYLDYIHRGSGMIGIGVPERWRSFGREIRTNADPLTVIDNCITQPDPAIEIPAPIFYKALSILCKDTLGLNYTLSSARWAARLRKVGVDLRRTSHSPWKSQVNRADYRGWVFHFTLDADNSEGMFDDTAWRKALETAAVALA